MSDPVVVDASALIALLLDSGPDGEWVERQVAGSQLCAPALLPFEVSNIVRRHELGGLAGKDQCAQAHDDLLDLDIDLWPYELIAPRVRQLRDNLSAYDASYVAVAERVDGPLVTLDRRLARAPGPRCTVATP